MAAYGHRRDPDPLSAESRTVGEGPASVLPPSGAGTTTHVSAAGFRVVLPVLLVGAGFLIPKLLGNFYLGVAIDAAFLALVAIPVGFLMHRCGLVSLGHGPLYGASAYLMAIAATRWSWSPELALAVGVLGGLLLSFVLGLMAVRLPGIGFSMVTLAFGQAVYTISTLTDIRPWTGGHDGMVTDLGTRIFGVDRSVFSDNGSFWPLIWVVVLLAILAFWSLSRSHFGELLEAIKDNEERTRFSGYGTYWPRVVAFTISGASAVIGGALFGLYSSFVSPDLVHWMGSAQGLIAAIIGGIGSAVGPLAGAIFFVFGRDLLSTSGALHFYTGAAFVLVLAVAPGGIFGALARWSKSVRGRFVQREGVR